MASLCHFEPCPGLIHVASNHDDLCISCRLLRLQELNSLLNSISPEARSPQYVHNAPAQAQQPTFFHCNHVSPQPLPATKGTGVFLPMACDQPEPPVKPLSRSHSSVSEASRDSTDSSSDLSRLDSLGYHSSETDCSFIPAYGCSFPSKLPAGKTAGLLTCAASVATSAFSPEPNCWVWQLALTSNLGQSSGT